MAYIPKDAKWYIADLVMECQIEDELRNVVHVNVVLVRADSPEEAFEKAEQLGREGEDTYLNPNNKVATWSYRGLRDLNVIYDELEHGTELIFEEEIGVSEAKLQAMLSQKAKLNVFRPIEPKALLTPNYACKEILDEVDRMIGHERE